MTDFFIKTIPLPVPRPVEADSLPVRVYETVTEQFDIFSHNSGVYSHPTVGWNLIKEKFMTPFMNVGSNIYDFAEKFTDFLYWLGVVLVAGTIFICVAESILWIIKKIWKNK